MRFSKQDILSSIKGQMIISCQALPGEPMYDPEKSVMYLFARAAKQAGSPCIRTNSIRDVVAIKQETGLPVIGLIKIKYDGYESYITPTLKEVDQLYDVDTDVIAFDCTDRRRGDGLTAVQYIKQVRQHHPDAVLMADIATYDEGVAAAGAGIDLVSTTMSGYTAASADAPRPNFDLVRRLSSSLSIPVIAEGRIHDPDQARSMLDHGAYAIVVGGAITRPLEIAQRFMEKIR